MAKSPSERRRGHKPQSKDLNLMPFMNLMLVIIPMLIAMQGSIELMKLHMNTSESKGEGSAEGSEEIKKPITLFIGSEDIMIKYGEKTDNETPEEEIIKSQGIDEKTGLQLHDLQKLKEELQKIKEMDGFRNQENIAIQPEDESQFDTLMKVFSLCKSEPLNFKSVRYSFSAQGRL